MRILCIYRQAVGLPQDEKALSCLHMYITMRELYYHERKFYVNACISDIDDIVIR